MQHQQPDQKSLDDIVKSTTPLRTSFGEYLKVFGAVEAGGIIGSQTGAHLSAAITDQSAKIVGGVLIGDYTGAMVGQLASYWHNNREKFRDDQGKLQKLKLIKDFVKVLVYDVPMTAASYAAASPVMYTLLESGWNKASAAAVSSAIIITTWHTLNYFVYSAIKNAADEKILSRIGSGVRSAVGYFTRSTPQKQ